MKHFWSCVSVKPKQRYIEHYSYTVNKCSPQSCMRKSGIWSQRCHISSSCPFKMTSVPSDSGEFVSEKVEGRDTFTTMNFATSPVPDRKTRLLRMSEKQILPLNAGRIAKLIEIKVSQPLIVRLHVNSRRSRHSDCESERSKIGSLPLWKCSRWIFPAATMPPDFGHRSNRFSLESFASPPLQSYKLRASVPINALFISAFVPQRGAIHGWKEWRIKKRRCVRGKYVCSSRTFRVLFLRFLRAFNCSQRVFGANEETWKRDGLTIRTLAELTLFQSLRVVWRIKETCWNVLKCKQN